MGERSGGKEPILSKETGDRLGNATRGVEVRH